MNKLLLFFLLFTQLAGSQTLIGSRVVNNNHTIHSSIALSGDGTTLAVGIIGTPSLNGNTVGTGYVKVYKNVSGQWVQVGSDIQGESDLEMSGFSVALSFDGTTIIVGAPLNDESGQLRGKARVYNYNSGTWLKIGNDIEGMKLAESLGKAVAISSDGSIVAVGSPDYGSMMQQNSTGKVQIFKYIAGQWSQIGQDIVSSIDEMSFGASLALSEDGTKLAVGAHYSRVNGLPTGKVRVYENSSNTWKPIGQPINGKASFDKFGFSVDLSADGTTVAVGAPTNEDNGDFSGQARVYRFRSGAWTQIGGSINGDNAAGLMNLGNTVSLSSDGNILVTGGSLSQVYQNVSGAWKKMADVSKGGNSQFSYISEKGTEVAILTWPANFAEVYDLSKVLSVNNLLKEKFRIFPNPASEVLNVDLEENIDLKKVLIYNLAGQVVLESDKRQVEVGTLAKGSYIVKIETSKGMATEKMILQ